MNFWRAPVSDTQITRRGRLWLYAVGALVIVFLVLPTVIVVPMSFSASQYLEFPPQEWSVLWYESYFASREWLAATRTSLLVAFLTAALATPLGIAAAYGLAAANIRGMLAPLVMLSPMMVPTILSGVGIFYIFVKLNLVNTLAGLVLAHTMLALPLVFIVAAAAFKNYDMNQERVARSLGASRLYSFWTITLPQIRFSAVSGALLAFLTSFDEVIIALFIAGGDNSTLTRAMFLALRDQIDPTIASVSTIMILVSSLLLAAAQIFGKEKTK